MKRFLFVALFMLSLPALFGQSRSEALREFQALRQQAYADYVSSYRKAYVDFMRKRWEAFQPGEPFAEPKRREPETPTVKSPDDNTVQTPAKIPSEVREEKPQSKPAPRPYEQKDSGKQSAAGQPATAGKPFKFTFYGTECSATLTSSNKFKLSSTQESGVASAWDRISKGSYDKAAAECRATARTMNLNDWGFYQLTRTLSNAFCGAGTNEAVVLQSFLMSEAGYMVRLARTDNKLLLLAAVEDKVYARPYLQIDGKMFYVFDTSINASSYYICNFKVDGERAMSMSMPTLPRFAEKPAKRAVRNAPKAGIETSVAVNANTMDFLTDYPACEWQKYASAPLSEQTKKALYPALRKAVEGKSERDAAQTLLSYIYEGFPYMVDDKQFGRERTLFAEEMYYYPYSDCEDRAILFVRLVQDLMGLKTVLLHYPDHVAAAVRFKGDVSGDYVAVGKDKYVVCDPTYIGAGVGMSMPDFKNVRATVIKLD